MNGPSRSNPSAGGRRLLRSPTPDAGTPVRDTDGRRWESQGACLDRNPELWFEDANSPRARRAEAVCQTCPVRRTCLATALVRAEEFGIWGGLPACKRRDLLDRLARGEQLADLLDAVLGRQGSRVA